MLDVVKIEDHVEANGRRIDRSKTDDGVGETTATSFVSCPGWIAEGDGLTAPGTSTHY